MFSFFLSLSYSSIFLSFMWTLLNMLVPLADLSLFGISSCLYIEAASSQWIQDVQHDHIFRSFSFSKLGVYLKVVRNNLLVLILVSELQILNQTLHLSDDWISYMLTCFHLSFIPQNKIASRHVLTSRDCVYHTTNHLTFATPVSLGCLFLRHSLAVITNAKWSLWLLLWSYLLIEIKIFAVGMASK